MGNSEQFAQWLQDELNKRGWDQAELSRRSNVSKGQISRVMSTSRGIGPDTAKAIAHALDLPEELVFREAGLLSDKPEEPPTLSEWIHLFLTADKEERERMLELARVLSRRSQKQTKTGES